MAFLLLLHQKMKLQRKENMLTLKQLRFSSQVDRMEKKVQKRQKYYDKLRKQIERQANCYKNSMNMQISNMFGLGMNSVNLGNPYGMNGAASGIVQNMSDEQIADILKQRGITNITLNSDTYKLLRSGGVTQATYEYGDIKKGDIIDINGNKVSGIDQKQATAISNAASALQQMASVQVTQMQTYASNMKAAYENNVSIWQEAALEQLEAQEEWEMDLLAEEQADMEADKNSVEVQLQRVQEEKKNIEQALGQAIQDSAPKFGLA